MNGPQLLESKVGHIATTMGAFFPSSHVIFRGHDLHKDLQDMDWVELYVFGITGRRFAREQLRLMHALWAHTSYPDARIWNNRVAALAGTARSTGTLGTAAALAISEASIYGRGIDIRAIEFLRRTAQRVAAGEALEACVREELQAARSIAGYGRPITAGDERIEPTMALARTLGLAEGTHVRLAFAIDDVLVAGRWRLRINYGALAAALAADLGLSAREHYLFMFPSFLAGMPPCFIEAERRTEGTLLPIPCAHVSYEGVPKRAWSGAGFRPAPE